MSSKTLSAQQRYLETSKNRKVLHRAKADSVSLYVHRDSASLTSKMTDNLSKISRVFEFDSNIFSTGVYERAFRGSVRDLLRRRQQNMTAQSSTAQKTESVSSGSSDRPRAMSIVQLEAPGAMHRSCIHDCQGSLRCLR